MKNKELTKDKSLEFLLIIGIFILALIFRVYGLDKVPPAFNGDEANLSLDAISISEGTFFLVGPNEGTSGALWLYLLAITFKIFGISITVARGLAVFVSLIGIGVAYFFTRYLLNLVLTKPQAIAIASLVALYLAVAKWYVEFSRIAFSANLAVLVQVSMFTALWIALKTNKQWVIGIAGLLLGLTSYIYIPFRLTPFVLLVFFIADALISWRQNKAFLQTHFKPLFVIAGIGGLLYAPWILNYFNSGLGDKARSFTVFNPVINQGDFWGTLSNSFWGSLAGFIPFITRVGHTPISKGVDTLSLIFFLIGLALILWQCYKPEFLFLAVWWAVMLIPSIIGPEGAAPHLRRALGTSIPTFILIGIGLVIPVTLLAHRYKRLQRSAILIGVAIACFLVYTLARQTYFNYYLRQLDNEAFALINHSYDFDLADTMIAEGDENTAYILPVDSAAGAIFPESSTLAFLYRNRGQATYKYITDDETLLFKQLQPLMSENNRLGIITWKTSKHTGADPKHIFNYLAEKWGTADTNKQYQYFDIQYFKRNDVSNTQTKTASSPPIALASLSPLAIDFEGQFKLSGASWAEQLNGDDKLWVELAWQKLSDSAIDYQVALWLEDEAGHVVGQTNKPLLNNIWHLMSSHWAVGDEERDFYLLPIESGTPPGFYHLKAVLYTLDEDATGSGRRLVPTLANVASDLAVPLGQVNILPPLMPFDRANTPSERLDLLIESNLTLLATTPNFAPPLRPGDQATFTFWWQTATSPPHNWSITLYLTEITQNNKKWASTSPQILGNAPYPSSTWPLNSAIKTFASIQLPPNLESGDYHLWLMLESSDDLSPDIPFPFLVAEAITVAGRPRSFDVPVMTYKLGQTFGKQITLLGYDFEAPSSNTETLNLTLYWQAEQEMNVAYKIFIHLLNAQGQIVAQADREPLIGEAPTSSWLSNEVISDPVQISSPNLAEVERIVVGLYNPTDGSRLQLEGDRGDSVSLGIED